MVEIKRTSAGHGAAPGADPTGEAPAPDDSKSTTVGNEQAAAMAGAAAVATSFALGGVPSAGSGDSTIPPPRTSSRGGTDPGAARRARSYLGDSSIRLESSLDMAREFLKLALGNQSQQVDFRQDVVAIFDNLLLHLKDVYAEATAELGENSPWLLEIEQVFIQWRNVKERIVADSMSAQLQDELRIRRRHSRSADDDEALAALQDSSGKASIRGPRPGTSTGSATSGVSMSAASVSADAGLPPRVLSARGGGQNAGDDPAGDSDIDPTVRHGYQLALDGLAFATADSATAPASPASFDGFAVSFAAHRQRVVGLLAQLDEGEAALARLWHSDLPA